MYNIEFKNVKKNKLQSQYDSVNDVYEHNTKAFANSNTQYCFEGHYIFDQAHWTS